MSNQLHRYRIVLDYIEPWLDEQDEATLKQIYADLLVLEKEGPSLGRPLVDRVKGSKLHHFKGAESDFMWWAGDPHPLRL